MRLFFFLIGMLFLQSGYSQVSRQDYISYQALIFDEYNRLLQNKTVGVQISIFQDSINTNAVYVEQHQKTTNANGLLTLEIGDGNVQSGVYDSVDWSSGPCFLKTEIDPKGGATYSITEITQMQYVPFALHAKTVELEQDSIFIKSAAYKITSSHITGLDSLSGTNTGDQDLSSLATIMGISDSLSMLKNEIPEELTAGANITISEDTISAALPELGGGESSASNFYLGQDTLGGIVYYLFFGEDGKAHGYILSKVDTYIEWQNTPTTTNATSLWDGKSNTSLMTDSPAKDFVDSLNSANHSGFNDWYIPSVGELGLLWNDLVVIIKEFNKSNENLLLVNNKSSYWSSTEIENNLMDAYVLNLFSGRLSNNGKTYKRFLHVIRTF